MTYFYPPCRPFGHPEKVAKGAFSSAAVNGSGPVSSPPPAVWKAKRRSPHASEMHAGSSTSLRFGLLPGAVPGSLTRPEVE